MKNTNTANRTKRFLSLFLALATTAAALFFALSCKHANIAPTPPSPVSQETPLPEKKPVPGGSLRMVMPENLSVGNPDYCPLVVKTEEALTLYSLVYEPLITLDETNALVPCLAVKWSRNHADPTRWTVSLRENVSFHSGETFGADDVIYTWRRLNELGAESYYSTSLAKISSITKIDESTLSVTVNGNGIFDLYALNFPIIKASSPFDGTGPYRAARYNDERIKLEAFDAHWDRTPYISTVEFFSRDSNETALFSYDAGQLDFVPTAVLAAGKYRESGVTEVYNYMTQGMETMLFNHRRSILTKTAFRLGLAHAINRNRIITNVYMHKARSADVPVPPDSWLYNPAGTQIDYNPTLSVKLFEEAGLSRGDDGLFRLDDSPLELTLLVSGTNENTSRIDAANAIAAQLSEVGITVEIISAPHGYSEDDSEFMTALRSMNWDIALVGFNLNCSNDLKPYLSQHGANNYGGIPESDFADVLAAIADAGDEESAREAFYALQERFIERLPFMVLYFRLNSLVCTAELKGVSLIREPNIVRNIKNWYLLFE